jgi:catechol 2,3-dioxygenase-like lactoylglutathione lyase family enzyme
MKTLTLFLSLLCAGMAMAQKPEPPKNSPVIVTQGAFFALSVADIQASTKWYEEKLGLKITMQTPKQDGNQATVLEGGGLTVELIQRDAAQPLATATGGKVKDNTLVYGVFKAGVVVDDFDKTLAELKARGVEVAIGPFAAKDKVPANVIVRDNAGNLLQVFGRR